MNMIIPNMIIFGNKKHFRIFFFNFFFFPDQNKSFVAARFSFWAFPWQPGLGEEPELLRASGSSRAPVGAETGWERGCGGSDESRHISQSLPCLEKRPRQAGLADTHGQWDVPSRARPSQARGSGHTLRRARAAGMLPGTGRCCCWHSTVLNRLLSNA